MKSSCLRQKLQQQLHNGICSSGVRTSSAAAAVATTWTGTANHKFSSDCSDDLRKDFALDNEKHPMVRRWMETNTKQNIRQQYVQKFQSRSRCLFSSNSPAATAIKADSVAKNSDLDSLNKDFALDNENQQKPVVRPWIENYNIIPTKKFQSKTTCNPAFSFDLQEDLALDNTTTNATSSVSHTPDSVRHYIENNESIRNEIAYSLSFAGGDEDVQDYHDDDDDVYNCPMSLSNMSVRSNAVMGQQLSYCTNRGMHSTTSTKNAVSASSSSSSSTSSSHHYIDNHPLPTTIHEALYATNNFKRAIVVTESRKPFKIVEVNDAWETLCGYSKVDAIGKTIGDLLQGPETNHVATTAMISNLLNGEREVGAVLTNYKKDGTKFRNRLRVGPLLSSSSPTTTSSSSFSQPLLQQNYSKNNSQEVTHFVGVLQEIHDEH